jgi:hypothetical protein
MKLCAKKTSKRALLKIRCVLPIENPILEGVTIDLDL